MQAALHELASNLDARRMALTKVRRIVASLEGHSLERTAIEMSVPLIYAQWEGFAKEACTLYLRAIERSRLRLSELREELIAYIWSPQLAQVSQRLSRDRKCAIARLALEKMGDSIAIPEKLLTVDTKSNLGFEALDGVCRDLGLGPPPSTINRQRLNALVHLRNNIAHGSSPSTLERSVFEQHAETAISAMLSIETMIIDAISNARYRRKSV